MIERVRTFSQEFFFGQHSYYTETSWQQDRGHPLFEVGSGGWNRGPTPPPSTHNISGPGKIFCYICPMEIKENESVKQSSDWKITAAIIILAALVVIGIWYTCKKTAPQPEPLGVEATLLQIRNDSKDSVLVYITLGTTWGCIQDIMDIPYIADSVPGQRGLQGTFILAPGDSTISWAPDTLGYNGVISFGYAPDNCPSPSYTNGLNQFEFIINNSYQPGNPQETVDISCVHGTNCVIRVNLGTPSVWNAGPTFPSIQSFANTMDKNQIGTPGVYPYGCDTCTASKSPPSCIPLPQPAQKNKICNVQRDAKLSGGIIRVIYLGAVNILK